jgi:tetratricopeptide (TPR) repeat protein
MNNSFKLAVISLCILAVAFLFVFGSVLPVLKSQTYIDSARSANSVRTIADFKANFDKVFDFYSPVGGEESAKYLTSNILSVVNSQQDISESVARELIDYIGPKIYPDTRHYIAMANLHTIALTRFMKQDDYDAAIDYYRRARELGPKLPPVLYGLLTLYSAVGDDENTREVGETILKYWPDDSRVSDLLATLKAPEKGK